MRRTEVQYATVDGLEIAWRQYGDGPDCVVVPPLISNMELQWEHEYYRRVLEFLGRFLSVTHFDKRGMGLSDRTEVAPTLDERVHDMVAVMDAAGIERAHVLGISEGGLMAQYFAAKYPERVDRLALANSLVVGIEPAPEFNERAAALMPRVVEGWGRDARTNIEWWSPSHADNESVIRWWTRYQRLCATRSEFERHLGGVIAMAATEGDFVTDIEAPTLVANVRDDQVVDPSSGRHLAELIPGARHETFSGDDHFFFLGDHWVEPSIAIVEFLLGAAVEIPSERTFATVVFTDIVGSTAQLASVGDAAWLAALEAHDEVAWRLAEEFEGTIVKSTGDGLVVRFARPQAGVAFCQAFATALEEYDLMIRAGVHAGEIVIRPNQDVTGIGVNLAARVEQAAGDGEIYVSSTVRDILLGGDERFEDAGEHELKGIDGQWRLYRLADA